MITIDANFEGGNFEDIHQIGTNHFCGKVAAKLKEPHLKWFCFRIKGNKGDKVIVDVHYGKNIFPLSTNVKPVISYNRKEWERIKSTQWSGSDPNRQIVSVTIKMQKNIAWVAFCFPYVYSDLKSYLQKIEKDSNIKIETLCLSPQKRAVYLVTLTELCKEDNNKIGVWIIAREHAGEVCGSFVCEGLINFLLSKNKLAKKLLNKFIFKIVPMVDVDGVAIGAHGKDQWPMDFGRDWTENPTISIVKSIKTVIDKWAKTHQYKLFFTIHSPGSWDTNSIYTFSKGTCSASLKYYYEKQHKFMELMEKYSPSSNKIYASRYCEETIPGMSTQLQYIKHNVLVFCLEVSYQRALPNGGNITIQSLREYGAGLAKAIYYLNSEVTL